MKRIFAVLMATMLVLSVGCGKAAKNLSEKIAEKAIEAQSGGDAKVDIKDGKMTVKTKDGNAVFDAGGNVSIPESFPKDVYIPKGAKILSSISANEGTVLTMEVDDTLAKVGEKYASEMKSQGWSELSTMNMNGQLMYSYKKDKRTTSMIASSNDNKTQVVLSLAQDSN